MTRACFALLLALAAMSCGGPEPAPAPGPQPTPQPEPQPQPTPQPQPEPQPQPQPSPQPQPPQPPRPTFAGNFSGSEKDVTTCLVAGTVETSTFNVRWTVSQSDDVANVTFDANCPPPFTADVEPSGVVAHFRNKLCPPVVKAGTVERTILVDGTLTLSGDTLNATMRWTYQRFDAATVMPNERCETESAIQVTR